MTRIYRIKRILFGKDFYAINICGIIFTKGPLSPTELNHELIHTAQQKELLYIGFYLWYAVEWLVLLLKYRNGVKAYFNIRFEKEAYRHQNDLTYLEHRRHFEYGK